ncbi:unnamed protein product [Sympodiomycopsis kandeliae]
MPPTRNSDNKKRPAPGSSSGSSRNTAAKGQVFRKSAAASKKAKLDTSNDEHKSNYRNQGQGSKPALKSAMKKSNHNEKAAKPPVAVLTDKGKAPTRADKSTNQKPKPTSKPQQQQQKPGQKAKPVKTQSENKDRSRVPSTSATVQMEYIHPPTPLPTFRIMTGSYERLLYGIKVTQTASSSASQLDLDLKPIFQFPAHPSSIKCLATGGAASKYLVTAGQDELVKIWDLRRKKEVGSLSGAESHGPPIAFEFPLPSHMLLTTENAILLYRTRDWALLHTFKGHTGRVNFISTHPSAKLALSGGQDGVLRAWDLLRGKPLGGTKMGMGHGGEMERLKWFGNNKGQFFALLGRTVVRIFRKSMAEVARIGQGTLTDVRLNDIAVWVLESQPGKSLIFVAREDKKVAVYMFDKEVFDELDNGQDEQDNEDDNDDDEEEEEKRTLKEVAWLEGHDSRVKSISLQPLSITSASESESDKWTLTATTISSDGNIKIFNLHSLVHSSTLSSTSPLTLQPTANYSTKGARLTCLSTCGGDGTPLGSRASDDYDDDDDDDNSEEDESTPKRELGAEDSDFVSDFDEDTYVDVDEDLELKKLEQVLKKAKAQGIDLDLLVNGGVDFEEGSDDDVVMGGDDSDEEEEEVEEDEEEEE